MTSKVTSAVAGVDFYNTKTDAQFAVGTEVTGSNGTEWVYVQASGAITQYHAVAVDESFQAASLTKALADVNHTIAFAQAAFADNEYGWVCKRAGGSEKVLVKASCAADGPLYTSASAGVLDDASASQTLIDGVCVVTTATASGTQAEVVIATNPYVRAA